ncbi:MAG: toxin-antitoxin system, antitoxin component [Puniceicoccaceae bacterium]|nr:MAG: toxin-antitoxin system, antitoxin component [Puniceicoccaceae bacterium]
MAQLSIYLDEKTQAKAKSAAKRANCSLSGWAREQLIAAADEGQSWPEGYFELFGSVQDASFTEAEPIDPKRDSPREML